MVTLKYSKVDGTDLYPDYLLVENADSTYDKETGTLIISNPTDEVIVKEANYLTFTADQANSEIQFHPYNGTFQYSLDNAQTWSKEFGKDNNETIILENIGDSVMFKGNNCTTYVDEDTGDLYNFSMTGSIVASGSVTSLTDGVGIYKDVDLTEACYCAMFALCTSLKEAPDILATNLKDYCYILMFAYTSLTSAPELPAKTLAASCYDSMFMNCDSLTSAPELPAKTLAPWCYSDMFFSCDSLTSAPELPALELAEACYFAMFLRCTSLVSAPNLLATVLPERCYMQMFDSCINLNITEGGGTIFFTCPTSVGDNATYLMFRNCGSYENYNAILGKSYGY